MYKVIINRGYEGWSLSDDFLTIAEAIKYATDNSYGSEFKVIKVIEWEIKEAVEKV